MKRSLVAVALAAHLAAPSFAFAAADAPPSVPGNPSVRLYAGAGGELFWSRSTDDRGVRGYEITKNGQSLGVRDALSYYDASLRANTAYTFTIAAVDTAGQKSPVATVRVGASATVQPAAPAAPARPAAPAPATPARPSTSTSAPAAPTAAPAGVAGAPAAPAGLRATVYGRSNAELFWNRAATPGTRYEVRRDGAVVATGDFTSHYAPNLSAGRDYAFEVVAIDGANRRSPAARVRFRTDANTTVTGSAGSTGTSAPVTTPATPAAPAAPPAAAPVRPATPATPTTPTTPTTPATPATPRPASPAVAATAGDTALAPRNLKLAVYSGTTAELLWNEGEQTRDNPIVRNEIRRDGTLIATVAGYYLHSYLDTARTPGREYIYEVTAISARGARGGATVGGASATRPAPTPAPTAGAALPADVAAKLATDFELVNGTAVEKLAATVRRLRSPEALGLRRTSTTTPYPDNLDLAVETWACPKGGTLGVQRQRSRQPDGSILTELDGYYAVRDCAIGPIVFDGDYSFREENGAARIDGQNVSLDDSRDLSTIEADAWGGSWSVGRPERSRFFANALSVETTRGAYGAARLFSDASDTANTLPDGSYGYTVVADAVTGGLGNRASIVTNGPFEFGNGRGAGRPTGGRLSIASGQDTWRIDAFNGDPASFTFTANAGGAATSYTVPWSDTYRFKGIDPARVQLGF